MMPYSDASSPNEPIKFLDFKNPKWCILENRSAVFDLSLLTLWTNCFFIFICCFIANFSTYYSPYGRGATMNQRSNSAEIGSTVFEIS